MTSPIRRAGMRGMPLSMPLGVLALASCQSLVGDYVVDDEFSVAPDPIQTQSLCEIESERFVFEVDIDSQADEPSLESYYERANPAFVKHLADVHEIFESGAPHTRVTYLMGAAGVGKSFVTRNALGAFPDEVQCTAEMGDLFGEDADLLNFEVVSQPDLATLDGDLVFNELPSFERLRNFELESLLSAAGCLVDGEPLPLVVIDGIDEVHDDVSHALLEAVDEFVMARADEGSFLHVLIAGRPEGFGTWIADPTRTEENSAIVDSFNLQVPQYRTAGDLEFRLRGYLDFRGDLETFEANDEFDGYLESFSSAVQQHPFLTYSIGNLAVGNVVIEQTAPDLEQDERQLKTRLFDDIVLRNSQSHQRPGDGGPLESAYRRVLEDIAARYAETDERGVFSVRSEDTVDVLDDDGEMLGEVRVRNVLNRGGIAFLTSATTATTRYRFEPFWLHAHLLERRNQRLDDSYEYQGCE